MEKSKRVAPINGSQKEVMVEFLRKHEELQTGKFSQTFTKAKAQSLWENLAAMLNAVPGGAYKEWRQWRKTWQDLKKNTKTKACQQQRSRTETGGGAATTSLTKEEAEILEMLSPLVTSGLPAVAESAVEFTFDVAEESDIENMDPGVDLREITATTSTGATKGTVTSATGLTQKQQDHAYAVEHLPDQRTGKKIYKTVTKTRRLENSLKISQKLVNVEEEKKDMVKDYYKARIAFMQSTTQYQHDKVSALNRQNDILAGILREMQNRQQQWPSCT